VPAGGSFKGLNGRTAKVTVHKKKTGKIAYHPAKNGLFP